MRSLLATLALLSVATLATAQSMQQPSYDYILANGRVIDGTGAAWYVADVGIRGDKIAAMGDLHAAQTAHRIDASTLVVAPGFIDVQGQSEFNLLADNRAASKITQGVTTEITGEGQAIAPLNSAMVEEMAPQAQKFGVNIDWRDLAGYLTHLERVHPAINLGTFVGAGGVRAYVIGREDQKATPAQLEQMKQVVATAMQQGAFGLSSALQYVPDQFATTDELVELAKVAKQYGGVYFTHQRSESGRIFPSLDEVFAISERANIPATVWHLKTAYAPNFGKMPEVLRRIEAARARGINVAASVYPYSRASNGLPACFPAWVQAGSTDAMLARLKDPAQRERAKREMGEPSTTWENEWLGSGGGKGIQIVQVLNPELKKYEGKTIEEIAEQEHKDPRDVAIDVTIADRGNTQIVIAIMDEADVKLAVSDPLVCYGADSPGIAEDGPLSKSKAHPRAFGTFPRVLAKYVRDEHTMSMEEAVRKMTSLAASRVGIMDRGLLRPGMYADITIFDPATIQDIADYNDSMRYSVGVKDVFVNGRPVVLDGKITDERPGRALRGPGYSEAVAK